MNATHAIDAPERRACYPAGMRRMGTLLVILLLLTGQVPGPGECLCAEETADVHPTAHAHAGMGPAHHGHAHRHVSASVNHGRAGISQPDGPALREGPDHECGCESTPIQQLPFDCASLTRGASRASKSLLFTPVTLSMSAASSRGRAEGPRLRPPVPGGPSCPSSATPSALPVLLR